MEDRRVGKQLPERLHVGVVERLIASPNELLVGVCHGPLLPLMRLATLFRSEVEVQ
jgi:hypothetical protein